uniref:ATP synthase F0 subunit 8 n=1 Tax=Trixagus sp. TRI01 TaxID=1205587 RepID=A0A0S2MQD3_9COLE|nr:ATP synthase F0 subunit 8 [Trixagus sp. TRI01]
MPQMSPMNWSIIMMTISYLIMMNKFMNYTLMTYKNNIKNNIKSMKLSWKW